MVTNSYRSTMKIAKANFMTRETQGLIPGTAVYVPKQYVHPSAEPYIIDGVERYGNMLRIYIFDASSVGKAGAQPIAIKEISYNQFRRMSFGVGVTEVEAVEVNGLTRGNMKANISNILGIPPVWGCESTGEKDEDGDEIGNIYLKEDYAFVVGERKNYAFPILTERSDGWHYETKDEDDSLLKLEFLSLAELHPINRNEPFLKGWSATAAKDMPKEILLGIAEDETPVAVEEEETTEAEEANATTEAEETEEAADDATTKEVADAPAEAPKKKKA